MNDKHVIKRFSLLLPLIWDIQCNCPDTLLNLATDSNWRMNQIPVLTKKDNFDTSKLKMNTFTNPTIITIILGLFCLVYHSLRKNTNTATSTQIRYRKITGRLKVCLCNRHSKNTTETANSQLPWKTLVSKYTTTYL